MTSRNITRKITGVLLAVLMVMSMVAVPMAGSVAAADVNEDPEEISESGTYWIGQEIYLTQDLPNDTTVTIREDTDEEDFAGEYNSGSDGRIDIDTANYSSGGYFLEWTDGSNTDQTLTFEIVEQTFEVTADENTVENEATTGSENELDIEMDSNRADYKVYVDETDSSLDVENFDNIFNGAGSIKTDADNEEYYEIDASNSTDYTLDFTGIDTGDYEFKFESTSADVSDTLEVSVYEPGDAQASFDKNNYEDARGDIVIMDIDVKNTDTFTYTFGDKEQTGYEYSVDVDANDEESVKLVFNTAVAGNEVVPVTVHDDTSGAELVNAQDDMYLEDPLEAETYDMSVSTNGNEKDIAGLNLTERETKGIETYVAPETEQLSEVGDIEEHAVESNQASFQDNFIIELESTGFEAIFHNAISNDFNEGEALDNSGVKLYLEEANPSPNQEPEQIPIGESTAIIDTEESEDKYYFVFDNLSDLDIEDEDEYVAKFEVENQYPFYQDEDYDADDIREEASTNVTFYEPNAEFENKNDDEMVEMELSESSTVSGTTTVAPNSELRVTARSQSPHPFVVTNTVEVTEERTFNTDFDISEVEQDHEFTVQVNSLTDRQDAIAVGEFIETNNLNVSVEDTNGEPVNATVSANNEDAEFTDEAVTFELENGEYTVEASADGYQSSTETVEMDSESQDVTLTLEETQTHELTVETVDESGENVTADISVGEQTETTEEGTVTFELEQGEYTVEATAEEYETTTQSVTLESDNSVTLEMVDMSESDGSDGTDDGTDDNTDNDTDDESSGQPGFGVVISLIALVGAALLAFRRQK